MQNRALILVIDDDPLNRIVLENTLVDDYRVMSFEGAQSALSFINKEKVDLIISDIRMPDMSGYEFLEKLKSDPIAYSIPVIIISANNGYEDEAKGLQLGAMDYIRKPFSPLIVKVRVKNQLAIKKKNDLLEQLASIDGLTEIPNRRLLDSTLEKSWLKSVNENIGIALMLIDIDFFKAFNEHYGYAVGDECLVKVARALEKVCKQHGAFVARYDGVRFAVIYQHNANEEPARLALMMHNAIDELLIPHQRSPICNVISITIGIVHVQNDFSGKGHDIFVEADTALSNAHEQQERVVMINR